MVVPQKLNLDHDSENSNARSVCLSPDDRFSLVANYRGDLFLFLTTTGELIKRLSNTHDNSGAVRCVRFNKGNLVSFLED